MKLSQAISVKNSTDAKNKIGKFGMVRVTLPQARPKIVPVSTVVAISQSINQQLINRSISGWVGRSTHKSSNHHRPHT